MEFGKTFLEKFNSSVLTKRRLRAATLGSGALRVFSN